MRTQQGQRTGLERIAQRLAAARAENRCALVPYVVGGRPGRKRFESTLAEVAACSDLLEVGMPFSDPVADGPVIAAAAGGSLAEGFCLTELLQLLGRMNSPTPVLLFSYFNPILALGIEEAALRFRQAGVAGLVVPDLPLDTPEGAELQEASAHHGLAWVQLVTPLTTPARRAKLLAASRGFVYAVLRTGITGGHTELETSLAFLNAVCDESPLPVCAGFGLRDASQARTLRTHAAGLIVGTALVERIEHGEPTTPYLQSLRDALQLDRP